MFKQAQNIIDKFGGPIRLAKALDLPAATVYRWTYTREKNGTNGVIPAKYIIRIVKLAEFDGIELTDEDWRIV